MSLTLLVYGFCITLAKLIKNMLVYTRYSFAVECVYCELHYETIIAGDGFWVGCCLLFAGNMVYGSLSDEKYS
jgi:hypothetical protein